MQTLNVALQGGGAHGAYTCGVLERLLDESDIEIEGISGTSAGAINAALLAQGLTDGGPQEAKRILADFWDALGRLDMMTLRFFKDLNPYAKQWNPDKNPMYEWYRWISGAFSPYVTNPFDYNPLRGLLAKHIDLEKVHRCDKIKLFVTATRVSDGHPRVFQNKDITVDTLLASACLPNMFRAVTIEGEAYWDGGYTGNPALWPLTYHCDSQDILLVQINPIRRREKTPTSTGDIMNRLNEITFNSGLISEMRAINFVSKLIEKEKLDKDEYKRMRLHMVERPIEMMELNGSSKSNVSRRFFRYLRSLGYQAGDHWLATHKSTLGKESSLDIEKVFIK